MTRVHDDQNAARPARATAADLTKKILGVEGVTIGLIFLCLIVIFMITAPKAFLGLRLYASFLATVPPPMIIALGLTLTVCAGEIDVSFPSVVAVASYVFSVLFDQYDMTWIAFAAALLSGAVLGFLNGVIITMLGIPSLIATLATMFLWGGLVTVVSGGISISIPDIFGTDVHSLFVGRFFGLPMQAVWAVAVAAFVWLLLNRHRFGESILFIGDSQRVAKVVGIPIVREKIKLFTLMGLLSAFAGVLLTLETTTYFNSQGTGYLLIVIAAVFIGGTSIFGGSAKVVGTVFGSLIVGVIEAGLVASGVQGFWTRFLIGLVFIAAVTLNGGMENPQQIPLLQYVRNRIRK